MCFMASVCRGKQNHQTTDEEVEGLRGGFSDLSKVTHPGKGGHRTYCRSLAQSQELKLKGQPCASPSNSVHHLLCLNRPQREHLHHRNRQIQESQHHYHPQQQTDKHLKMLRQFHTTYSGHIYPLHLLPGLSLPPNFMTSIYLLIIYL